MAPRKKRPRGLRGERKKTDRSLKAERSATDRSLARRSDATGRTTDKTRRRMRKEADRGLARERKAADARARRRSSNAASPEVERERRSAATALARERRRADQVLARQRRGSDSVLAQERRQRRQIEKVLFGRERDRTDRHLGDERSQSDAHFLAAERRLGDATTAGEKSEAAVLLRDEFMAIISHDLRTPLNVITLNAARLGKMVTSGEGSDEIRKMCLQIEDAAARIGGMVEDLLEAERMALAHLRMPVRPGDLREAAREAIDFMAPVVSARGVSLSAKLPEEPVVTHFDRNRMLQVFSNLLGNAVKFTPKGGMVRVAMEGNDRLVRVSISDTGPGIPSDQHDRVFRRFTQVGGGRGGVGLGLYIARRIVEAHRGKIGVVSRPGEGSTFFFTLPRIADRTIESGGDS